MPDVYRVPADGPKLKLANDVIGDAWAHEAATVVVPAARLDPAFFDLSTRIAGEFAQKFVQYHLQLVIEGDISAHLARSNALRDWVRESNKGTAVRFVDAY